MTAGGWTAEELDRVGTAEELRIAARQADGTLRAPVPIWVVRVGDELYVRSWRGAAGAWFRAAQRQHSGHICAGGVEQDVTVAAADPQVADAVDAAYQQKYASYPSYVPPMVSDQARATTLKLLPHERETRS